MSNVLQKIKKMIQNDIKMSLNRLNSQKSMLKNKIILRVLRTFLESVY